MSAFSKIFKQEGTILAGTEILYTWSNNKLVVEIDGEVKKVIRSSDFAEVLFRTYLDRDSINKGVSKTIRENWYTQYDPWADPVQKKLRSMNQDQQIEHEVKCILKGNNKDVFCTSNIQHQNRPWLGKGVYYGDEDEEDDEDEGSYYIHMNRHR